MRNLRFLFYKLPPRDALSTAFNCIVSCITYYNHVEIMNEDGIVYSSSQQRGFYCGRYANIARDTKIVNVSVDENTYRKVFDELEKYRGKPYNYCGLWLNFIPILNHVYYYDGKDKEVFCSEMLSKVLIDARVIKMERLPAKTSPDDLYTMLIKQY